jgi:hypothetical protein
MQSTQNKTHETRQPGDRLQQQGTWHNQNLNAADNDARRSSEMKEVGSERRQLADAGVEARPDDIKHERDIKKPDTDGLRKDKRTGRRAEA